MYATYRVKPVPEGKRYRWGVFEWDVLEDTPCGQAIAKFKDKDLAEWFANIYENKDRL